MDHKNHSIAFLLWLLGFVGLCGIHRVYMGRKVTGVIWLMTFGLYGFGQVYDMFILKKLVSTANAKIQQDTKSNVLIIVKYAPTYSSFQGKGVLEAECSYCGHNNNAPEDKCKICLAPLIIKKKSNLI